MRRWFLAALVVGFHAYADDRAAQEPQYSNPTPESPLAANEDDRFRWFVFLDLVNVYPRLESEELIEDYFNPAMRFLAPTFDDVTTVGTLRDRHVLWVPQLGIGRLFGERWRVFFQAGYTSGKVRTEADDRSWILLPLHTDFEIQRGAASSTLGLDFFPWKHAALDDYDGFEGRLRAARPKLGGSVTFTRATYDAKIKAAFKPLPHFLDMHLSDTWYLPSINLNIGAEVPISKTNSVSIHAGYNFFFDQEDDFEGPEVTVTWSHYFK